MLTLENQSAVDDPQRALAERGFSFTAGETFRDLLEAHGSLSDWDAFAASWGDLGLDRFMADGGRYRRRRHAAFAIARDGSFERKPHQPHYQSRDYNPLNGGIARWFEPVLPHIAEGATLAAVLRTCGATFGALSPEVARWHVEVHQFRIEARVGEAGQPTPEGLHRDGVDWVLVLLVRRHNISRGVTTIHDLQKRPLGSFTLADPLDAALVDDRRVYHGVTPVEPKDPRQDAFRDVLVVTFRREG